ncbi:MULTISPECIES: PAAR domain-containing protein [Pseudomonas]|nr:MULTISPECIES: PAAR domain-containing protein [Pseudomonas]MDH1260293.1 PAAR domain-containing protein [Pseudomonas atacamensis]
MAKPAARLSDLNACPITGHGTNPGNSGSGDVNINGMPVLRVGDTTACGDTVTEGISNILINGKPMLSWAVRRPTEA